MQKKPIFVKIDEYKEILDIITLIKANIKEAKLILQNVNDLKNKEDEELEIWKTEIHDIQRKMDFMDKVLLDPDKF